MTNAAAAETKVTIGESRLAAHQRKPYFVNVVTHVGGGVLKGGKTSVEVHRFNDRQKALAFAQEQSA